MTSYERRLEDSIAMWRPLVALYGPGSTPAKHLDRQARKLMLLRLGLTQADQAYRLQRLVETANR